MPTISLPQQLALAKGARFTECQREYAPAARTALQRALQTKADPLSALWELGQRLVKPVLSNLYANPRPITESGLFKPPDAALAGAPPGLGLDSVSWTRGYAAS